jgi:hypothetical protein
MNIYKWLQDVYNTGRFFLKSLVSSHHLELMCVYIFYIYTALSDYIITAANV